MLVCRSQNLEEEEETQTPQDLIRIWEERSTPVPQLRRSRPEPKRLVSPLTPKVLDMSGREGDNPPELEAMRVERDRLMRENEELRQRAVAYDPNKPLREYTAPRPETIQLGYQRPTINANQFTLPPAWMSMVQQHQFHGFPHEDAVQHLAIFEELCGTLKVNNMTEDDIKLIAFTFSLADRAKSWIRGQRPENMNTWAKVSVAFLNRFFPPSKTNAI